MWILVPCADVAEKTKQTNQQKEISEGLIDSESESLCGSA
jgi:hypothetical protein